MIFIVQIVKKEKLMAVFVFMVSFRSVERELWYNYYVLCSVLTNCMLILVFSNGGIM